MSFKAEVEKVEEVVKKVGHGVKEAAEIAVEIPVELAFAAKIALDK